MLRDFDFLGEEDKPHIILDATTGEFSFEGVSMPENPNEIYKPVFNWLEEYFKAPAKTTVFNIKLKYINTSSLKKISDIFNFINLKFNEGNDIKLNWFYEEEEEITESKIQDLFELILIPTNLIKL